MKGPNTQVEVWSWMHQCRPAQFFRVQVSVGFKGRITVTVRVRIATRAYPDQACDDAGRGIMLVQRVRELLPRCVQRLAQLVSF